MASSKGAIIGLPTYRASQFLPADKAAKDYGKWMVWRRAVTLYGVEPTIDGQLVDTGAGSAMWDWFKTCDAEAEAVALAEAMNADADDFVDRF